MTYGNGTFVAVATSGSVMTSSDGVTWTSRSAAVAGGWMGVTYGKGLFVAVAGSSDKLMTSPDGVTWTARTGTVSGNWSTITYGNGNFVAASYLWVMYSTDGITWTKRPAVRQNWNSLAYGNGKFVAVVGGNTSSVMTAGFTVPTTPDEPTALATTIAKGSTSVSFTAGADGGSSITNYEYQLDGTGAWTAFSPADTASPVTISGLTNGTSYTVKLRAVNAIGAGTASTASSSFTPLLRLVTPAQEGTLSILAGTGSSGTPTPGPATSSALSGLSGLVVDASGNTFIADSQNNKVFKITSGGTLSVFAGTGAAVSFRSAPPAIAPGPATSADLAGPSGLAVDASGNVYVAVTSSRQIVKITPAGTLSIVAGTGQWFDPMAWPRTDPVLTPGPATSVDLNRPTGVAVDSAGNLFILDGGYRKVLKVTTGGTLSVVAGSGSYGAPTAGPATSSDLGNPTGIAVDSSGNLYIADSGAKKVLKVTSGGTLSVFAGTGTSGLPTPGAATSSNLGDLSGIAVDSSGNVFISDPANQLIEKITPAGALTVVAGTGYLGTPTAGPVADSELGSSNGVATDADGNIYILDGTYYLLEKVSFTPPVVAPDAPTSLLATAGNGSASIAFTAGADGGAAISKYQYQLGSGSWVDAVGTSSPITIIGLTNGTAYTVKLRAVNTAGSGAESVASASFTPRTVPGAPSITSVTPGVSTVLVAFTAGATGGSVITGYEYQLNGAGSWFSLGTTSSPASIGVTNGVAYTVKLRAVNVAGSGAASGSSGSFTPRTVPSALTAVVATDGNGSASISFTAGSNGGASILKYQYRLGAGSWVDAGLTSPISITGLANYTTYSVQVRAVNAAGGGAASVAVTARPQAAGPTIGVAYSSGKLGAFVGFAFNRPAGSTLVGFTVRAYSKGTTTVVSSCQTTPSGRSCYIPSLTSGTEYDIRVQAYFTLAGETKVRSSLESATSTVRVNS